VERAYLRRYPIVIADEHQDASALQDAVVRRLGTARLSVLADPMQLIHGFRGARIERLEQHEQDCDEQLTLNTPHRWHGSAELADWLLAVRARLQGEHRDAAVPAQLCVIRTDPGRGVGPVKAQTTFAALRSRQDGLKRIGIIVRTNQEAADMRGYLSREGLRPRQLGGEDFEEAREDIEQLPLLTDPRTLARHALERVKTLVPTLPTTTVTQISGRLHEDRVHRTGAGAVAAVVLGALECLYTGGPSCYFQAVVGSLEGLAQREHHLPRADAVRALRETAAALAGKELEVSEALAEYSARIVAATHVVAPRLGDGVFVMTAHQAKGKEFDTVILANPLARDYEDDDEGRRLFYVAVTRATSRWVVVAPQQGATSLLTALGI
jgi:superfamily I DNA/RNA helicase